MTTYFSSKPMPYVYRCIHKTTGDFYIGYRESNRLPSDLDLPEYKTSSNAVHNNFSNFDWEILAEFFDGSDAYDFEQKLIYENWGNPLMLNESCFYNKRQFRGSTGMSGKKHKKESKEKISNKAKGNTRLLGHRHSEETKKKMSDYHSTKTLSAEHKRKLSISGKNRKQSESNKNVLSELKRINRVCRIRDRKEMDIANFNRYP